MPRMRHPKVEGAYEAHEDQVSMLRMSGWLTEDEWERAGLPDWEPEPEPDDDEQDDKPDDEPDSSGEQQNEAPRRTRQRATTKKEKD